jgi:hypothetical protein
VRPESLAPAEGAAIPDIAGAFALSSVPAAPVARVDGHLFLLADGRDVLTAPDRWAPPLAQPRPGETAFVLARPDPETPWTYLGVGRWQWDGSSWAFPAPPFGVWRQLSTSRAASRTLDRACLVEAERVAGLAMSRLADRWTERGGQRGRVVGRAAKGGLRISGGDGGFGERTISLLDLGWALAAAADARERGGLVDEARINRLRYLDGTPKEATRWIDSGWALAVVDALGLRNDSGSH